MKHKWKHRVFIDLFAGAGRASLQGSRKIVDTSSLLALSVPDPFDHYIFCEENSAKIEALEERVGEVELPSHVTKTFITGDANKYIGDVKRSIPKAGPGNSVLSFCFIDPYKLGNFKFNTLRILSDLYVDILILIPTHMDARRNVSQYYQSSSSRKVDDFIGNSAWRDEWELIQHHTDFETFIVEQFSKSMVKLGYKETKVGDTQLIRNTKGVALYRLAFYSRHDLGRKFWNDVKRLSNHQLPLF